MNRTHRTILGSIGVAAFAAAFLLSAGAANAVPQYLDDGAVQNSAGGWDLPAQGTCPAGPAQSYTGIDTRPECVALRLNIAQGSCTGNYAWTTAGVCNDLDPAVVDLSTCESKGDRLWNPGTSKCAIVMSDDDRNDVTCLLHGGTWVSTGTCTGSWIMPAGNTYSPVLLGSGTGPGDQCLRCHNTRTQYNGPRVRDTEDTMFMGHKNMARKVVPGMKWGGPPFTCTVNPLVNTAEEACYDAGGNWIPVAEYPGTDTGQDFDWAAGTIDHDNDGPTGTAYRPLYWIYGDWLSALPRAIYSADPDVTATPDKPGVSYSCARCHTTGWTSDASINYGVGAAGTSTREPERSFPGITWDGIADATTGQVNLAGGVSGDSNKSASWDVFGITCSRCHNSAIDRTSTATSGFGAPAGMSSHHNNLTAPDTTSGVCTDTRWTREYECTTNGGQWLTACSSGPNPAICQLTAADSTACGVAGGTWTASAYCSNAYFTDQTSCTSNGTCSDAAYSTQAACTGALKTWTAYTWNVGFCKGAAPTGSAPNQTCGTGTLRLNGTQAACAVDGGTWSFSKCSVAGICSKGPAYTDAASCQAASGQWRFATDIIRCADIEEYGVENNIPSYAAARWTGNNKQRGMIITSLCMNCHRQEKSGKPYDNSADAVGSESTTEPGNYLKVGPYHSTVTFVSHPHGNQFLNSPHAKFTGKFNQVATGKFQYNMSGEYKSFFETEGEAAGTGNGCTGCHDVHSSTVTGEKPFAEECTECHAKDLSKMKHAFGTGTPMEKIAEDPMEPCVVCHMPGGEHLFRINSDAGYSLFPMPAAINGVVNANVAADGVMARASWVDLDQACGQCHGGGTAHAETTGTMAASSATLTVADSSGFAANERVLIKGAGALYYDDDGVSKLNDDFETYVKTVDSATQITLAGKSTKAVTDAEVVQNPTQNGGAYFTKAQLATYAKGIHNDKPFASFGYTYGNPNVQIVNFDASASTCNGSAANCDAYTWDFGDSSTGSGVTASHTYAAAGTYTVTMTVEQYGVGENSVSKTITVSAYNTPPTVAGTACGSILTPNSWSATMADSSTDAAPGFVKQVTVNWGDGTATSSDTISPFGPFSHNYLKAGSFTLTHTAIDNAGKSSKRTCTIVTSYYTISGNVKSFLGANIPSATVQFKVGTTLVKTVYTSTSGAFTTGKTMKPGTYNIVVTKTGYTFPATSKSVGGDQTGFTITATSPTNK